MTRRGERRLAAPGPVAVPASVAAAGARPPLHHRTPAFAELLSAVRGDLARLADLPDADGLAVLTGSGTAAFEAAFLAAVPAGAPVLAVEAGKFGARWAALAERYGHETIVLSAPWGDTVAPDRIADALRARPDVAAVTLVHSETSTGVLHDLGAQAAAVRAAAPDARIVADAVTSLGVSELRPVEWGLDAWASGSQKGVMAPPGLAFAWLSPRVLVSPPTIRRAFAHDLHAEIQAQRAGRTGTTPAVTLVAGLAAGLPELLTDGPDALRARRARANEALLAAGEASGCTRFAVRPSPAVAALRVPDGVHAPDVVAGFARRGVRIAGGQDDAKPYLIRPSAMGDLDDLDVIGLAGTLEAVLRELGRDVPFGAAAGAAMRVLEGISSES